MMHFCLEGKYPSSWLIDWKVLRSWRKRGNGRKCCKLAEQPTLRLDLGDVESGKELADRELIQLEESELCAKTVADTPEESQE